MFLMTFSKSCVCLNWLSGALVRVEGSDFIGQLRRVVAALRQPAEGGRTRHTLLAHRRRGK